MTVVKGSSITYEDLERASLAFVLEDESWPVFLEWARTHYNTEAMMEWLNSGPSVEEIRTQWMDHSEDPFIREYLADFMRRTL